MENLLAAWQEFIIGKRSRADVQTFARDLMHNLLVLHEHLASGTYFHAPYMAFTISDPKTRSIHKASVADRVLHRAIYRKLYPFFDRIFVSDSFSCRMGKGTHRALDRFDRMARQVSKNHRRTVWVLKCDVRKFFASVDQRILLGMLHERIIDKRLVQLFQTVLGSFSTRTVGVGLPLGNLTSQLFANVYLDAFDQFMKQRLHVKRYIRYADDFAILSDERQYLECLLPIIADFLWRELRLQLHPMKVELRTVASGVDFLGWIHFPDHRVLRTTTRRRMFESMRDTLKLTSVASYQGMLRYGNSRGIQAQVDEYISSVSSPFR